MTQELEALGRSVAHATSPPPTLTALHRRRARRRLRIGSALGLASVLVAGVATTVALDTNHPVAATELNVSPSSGLRDGDLVEVTIDGDIDPSEVAFVAECASEVVDMAFIYDKPNDEIASWCSTVVTNPGQLTHLQVSSTIATPEGDVDCSALAGRCVTIAKVDGGVQWRHLTFVRRPDVGPLAITSIEQVPADPALVAITGSGVAAGERLTLFQCLDTLAIPEGRSCDASRSFEVKGTANGTFHAEMRIFDQILVYLPETGPTWVGCDDCTVWAVRSAQPFDAASAELPVGPRLQGQPRFAVTDSRRDGDWVILGMQGDGFQPGQITGVGLCVPTLDSGEPACTYPGRPGNIVSDERGTFSVEWWMPVSVFQRANASYCMDENPACVLALTPGTGMGLWSVTQVPSFDR